MTEIHKKCGVRAGAPAGARCQEAHSPTLAVSQGAGSSWPLQAEGERGRKQAGASLTSRSAPARRGSPCSPAWWCSARSPARHKASAPGSPPPPAAGRSLQAVPVPAHPFALLGGAVQPRHHLAVQQQEQRLVRHLRSPLTRTRRHGNGSAAATAAAGPLRAEPSRPALPFPAAARPPQRRPAAGPDPSGADRPPPASPQGTGL